jgi:5,10-methylenetetrahydromethanopterin reductase
VIPVGVLLNAEYPADELIRLGRLCEDLGYSQLWYTDIRLFRECYIGLAALAVATKRIALGPGVSDPYSRHPAVTASTMATLDELSGGRALLGFGLGGTSFPELGIAMPRPITALREAVGVMRRLWQGEEVTFEGKVISLNGGRIQFSPVRDRLPIYFATHGARIASLAGEIADGVLIANTMVPVAVDFYLRQVQEGAGKAGRSLDEIDVCLRPEACISEDEEAAFAVMRRRVAQRLLWTYPHWEYLERLGVALPADLTAIAARKSAGAVDEIEARLPRQAVESMAVVGSPERVADQVASALRPGISRIVIRMHALPGGSIVPMLRSFVEEVMPSAAAELGMSPTA